MNYEQAKIESGIVELNGASVIINLQKKYSTEFNVQITIESSSRVQYILTVDNTRHEIVLDNYPEGDFPTGRVHYLVTYFN